MRVKASRPASVIEMDALVDVEDVEIVQTGIKYPLASGPRTFTVEDLQDVVESQGDAAVKAPRVKIGHVASLGIMEDGQPAIGTITDLKLEQNGHLVTGTLHDVPEWYASILPSAYPARSIEALTGVKTSTDNSWQVVLTDLAMLGVMWPGVGTLEDIQQLYSKDGPDNVKVLSTRGEVEAVFGKQLAASASVTGQANVDQVMRAYREHKDADQFWWWIRSMMMDPDELIVEDEEHGELYRVPYEIKGDDVEFKDPIAVKIVYEDKPKKEQKEAASMALVATIHSMHPNVVDLATFKSRKEYQMGAGIKGDMDPVALRNALGLADDASDDDVKTALASAGFVAKPGEEASTTTAPAAESTGSSATTQQQSGAPDNTAPSGPTDPAEQTATPAAASASPPVGADGIVRMDVDTYNRLMTGAAAGLAAHQRLNSGDRDGIISAAINAGKIAPARKEFWEKKWGVDEEEVRTLLTATVDKGGLAPGLIPVSPTGTDLDATHGQGAGADDSYPAEWLPEVRRGGGIIR